MPGNTIKQRVALTLRRRIVTAKNGSVAIVASYPCHRPSRHEALCPARRLPSHVPRRDHLAQRKREHGRRHMARLTSIRRKAITAPCAGRFAAERAKPKPHLKMCDAAEIRGCAITSCPT